MKYGKDRPTTRPCGSRPFSSIDGLTTHLLVEVEIEVLQPLVRIAEGGLLASAFEQAVGAAGKLVLYEGGDEIDRSHTLGARLLQSSVQNGGHTAEAQLLERPVELDEVHGVS